MRFPAEAAPNELTAREAVARIATRRLTAERLIRSCLDQIERHDGALQAWAFVDGAAALDRARALDRSEQIKGPLHGIPVGIKDVIDTADMPTAYGAPYYRNWRPNADAACVALLKRAGAIILGKTMTPELACGRICPTANPWNVDHTAGGSSAGSAAALAATMVPLSIGTQTAGSLIRPASYNGVVGFKPTFGALSVAGCKYFNGSLDTLGLMARTVDDVVILWQVLIGVPVVPTALPQSPPRIGLCRTPWWSRAEESTRRLIETGAARLAEAGADVVEVTLPAFFDQLVEVHEQIQAFETARSYAAEYDAQAEQFNSNIRRLCDAGLAIPYERYKELMRIAETARSMAPSLFEGLDAILVPSADGEAPAGHDNVGNSSFNRPWTLLRLPCINVPGMTGPQGLPVGIQVTGPHGSDDGLLSVARWVEAVLRPDVTWPLS